MKQPISGTSGFSWESPSQVLNAICCVCVCVCVCCECALHLFTEYIYIYVYRLLHMLSLHSSLRNSCSYIAHVHPVPKAVRNFNFVSTVNHWFTIVAVKFSNVERMDAELCRAELCAPLKFYSDRLQCAQFLHRPSTGKHFVIILYTLINVFWRKTLVSETGPERRRKLF